MYCLKNFNKYNNLSNIRNNENIHTLYLVFNFVFTMILVSKCKNEFFRLRRSGRYFEEMSFLTYLKITSS